MLRKSIIDFNYVIFNEVRIALTESTVLSNYQFLTYAIIDPRVFHAIGILLYTVMLGMMGRVI